MRKIDNLKKRLRYIMFITHKHFMGSFYWTNYQTDNYILGMYVARCKVCNHAAIIEKHLVKDKIKYIIPEKNFSNCNSPLLPNSNKE